MRLTPRGEAAAAWAYAVLVVVALGVAQALVGPW